MLPFRDDNPTRALPVITVLIIIANFVVFLYQTALPGGRAQLAFVYQYGAVPAHILQGVNLGRPMLEPAWLTIFTAMFMHGGWLHILGNMLFLWVFGNNVEDNMGKAKFIIFYLTCGFAATAAQLLMMADSPAAKVPMLGASGAVAGVLGAYLVKFPGARVRNLVFLFPFITVISLPAWVVLGFWFVLQFFSAAVSGLAETTGGVAYFAHVGGFIAGMILIGLFAPPRPRRES
jgi:membrane associated rhomboid family serine protease